jgi:hypothetical protein
MDEFTSFLIHKLCAAAFYIVSYSERIILFQKEGKMNRKWIFLIYKSSFVLVKDVICYFEGFVIDERLNNASMR